MNKRNIALLVFGVVAAGMVGDWSMRAYWDKDTSAASSLVKEASWGQGECPNLDKVVEAVRAAYPNTPIDSLRCADVPGLYEFTAKTNVAYVDPTARFLIVGSIFDMKTGQDLTAPVVSKVRGGAVAQAMKDGKPLGIGPANSAAVASAATGQGGVPVTQPVKAPSAKAVEWGEIVKLPGAIRHGKLGAKTKIAVFGNPACGYCRALMQTVEALDVEVIELPRDLPGLFDHMGPSISTAICAGNGGPKIYSDLYAGVYPASAPCEAGKAAMESIRSFAEANGWRGTPVIVREDGAVMQGFAGPEALKSFIGLGG